MYRGGGKPDEVVGLGVKPSGAKFICRSQGRTFGNISTATSSTAPLGHYIGNYSLTQDSSSRDVIILEKLPASERFSPIGNRMAVVGKQRNADCCCN